MSKFDDLTRELEEEERKDLLEKLQKDKDDTHFLTPKEAAKVNADLQTHRTYARKYIKDVSFIDRLLIWVKSILSGKQEEDIILENIFDNLKKQINKKCPGYIDWNKMQLTSKFITSLFSLITQCKENLSGIRPLFYGRYYQNFLCTIFEKDFQGKLQESYAGTNPENIKEIHTEFFDKKTYDKERLNKQKAFFLNLDNESFLNFHQELHKMDLISALLEYDYPRLLGEFLIPNLDTPISVNNIANFSTVYKHLESLFALLDRIDFSIKDISVLSELLHYSKKTPLLTENGEIELTVQDIDHLGSVIGEINRIKKKIPYLDIFKYYSKNLFFAFPDKKEQKDFVPLYKENKKKQLQKSWDEYYVKLKKEDLYKTLHTVLPKYNFASLSHLNIELYNSIKETTDYKVTSIYNLNLCFEILRKLTDLKMFLLINKLLIKGKFVDDKIKLAVTGVYQTLTTGSEKITMFDNQFERNNSLGKSVSHYLKIAQSSQNVLSENSTAADYFADVDFKGNKIYDELKTALHRLIEFYESITIIARRSSLPISNLGEIGGVTSYDVVKDIEIFLNKMKIFMKLFKYVEFIY